ncbi:hypothetical protein [Nocardiopsis ansamitocini]|nr:hypothetical protein [Nocardiopsis ansamitocini]
MQTQAPQLAQSANIVASTVTPGVLGFIVIALIGGALYFLMRNMNKHLAVMRASDFGAEPAPTAGDDKDKTE